ncbi:hypothetical protein BRE01_19310 [Brevibacillus reuszeri]|uniref:Uncharacterized protein n=1 Tax=Brevibacillus reuszeri TaxID=54915 RepID=A0ABQ0TLE8_9BACL|nr:hypothetical protein [Brevibacillus reuszeri]MED1857016.1 hypothetical protein [Brevibacillus reuszeri]GED68229.1 hypothetical protein BRE01_19310 [Brevibacillus reuszeri]
MSKDKLKDKHHDSSSKEAISNEKHKQAYADMNDLNDAASAFFRIPVFFSHQNLFTLGPSQPPLSQEQLFIIRLFKEIQKVLLFPRTIPNTDQYPNTTLENIRTMINSSYGTIAALLKPTRATGQGEPYSPFLQIEPSMSLQYGLPLILVKQDTISAGGIWGDAGPLAPYTPLTWHSSTGVTVNEFFESVQWKEALQNWAGQVRSGYFIQTGPEYKYSCND